MKKTNEQIVKEKHPNAKCIGVATSANGKPVMWMISGAGLGENYSSSKKNAWNKAAKSLEKHTN